MKKKIDFSLLLMPVLYLITSILVIYFVSRNGMYPSGSDTMYHIYRGNFVYQSIQDGDWYPLYHPMWYNGVELLRYWAPLPAYVMAGCQALTGGDPMQGYLLFVGLICFFGAVSWLIIGKAVNRPWLGGMIGLLWFFMPNNLLALFVEGNLARALCMVFLPIFLHGVIVYLRRRSWKCLLLVTISFSMMVLCHLGYAGMIALAVLLYLLIYRIINGRQKAIIELIPAIVLGFFILGVWLFPSLNGGITSMDNSENMKNFFQSVWISLNPIERYHSHNSNFYFGLSSLILAMFGGICSYKKSMSGFWTAIIIFLCTTTAMYPIIKILPGSQYLWMLRFISIALCMILYHFLLWDTLKKPLVVGLFLLLVVDVVPSLTMVYGTQSGETAEYRLDQMQETTLIAKAQEITNQRIALMDESTLGATGAWLVSGWRNATGGTFGAGWEGANTASNIAQLNRSLTNGKFLYLFDRCLELGNDSVIIQLSQIDTKKYSLDELEHAANQVGYHMVEQNRDYRLYHYDQNGNWGTITKYEAIGIGSAAPAAALTFPAMKEAESHNLNHYTFEQLSRYKLVYLAGFTYDDRSAAEQLVMRLSEAGIRVVISADGIPQDKQTHAQNFLGVSCNTITFSNGYPTLGTRNGQINTDLFPQGFTNWKTVYLDGLDQSMGSLYDNDLLLDYYGTIRNENIIMIGLNLPYFYQLTEDESIGKLLSEVMGLEVSDQPIRTIIPLSIEYHGRMIRIENKQSNATADIESLEDSQNINTGLSYHDIFHSDQDIAEQNNLLIVNDKVTIIHLNYPYFMIGCVISIAGIVLLILYLIRIRKSMDNSKV